MLCIHKKLCRWLPRPCANVLQERKKLAGQPEYACWALGTHWQVPLVSMLRCLLGLDVGC